MEREYILNLTAGRETDALVGEFVFKGLKYLKNGRKGYYNDALVMSVFDEKPTNPFWEKGDGNRYFNTKLPRFSLSEYDSFQVLKQMGDWHVEYKYELYRVKFVVYQDFVIDPSFPLAVCKAALMVRANLYQERD